MTLTGKQVIINILPPDFEERDLAGEVEREHPMGCPLKKTRKEENILNTGSIGKYS